MEVIREEPSREKANHSGLYRKIVESREEICLVGGAVLGTIGGAVACHYYFPEKGIIPELLGGLSGTTLGLLCGVYLIDMVLHEKFNWM